MRFIHTADWQVGKPFARIADADKRSLLRQERIEVIKRIGAVAAHSEAEFVLVAGDLFDSPSADKATVSAACSAIGQIGMPVVAIPGNHDNGGPGSVWGQDFFKREQEALAPNLVVLAEAAPYDLGSAVILPCPLTRRSLARDPAEWLWAPEVFADIPADAPRIVLAHGSCQAFTSEWDDDAEGGSAAGIIDLQRIPGAEVDYVALGDWHGTKQVGRKVWYAGTPELDRFTKGGDHDPGNILVVDVARGIEPAVSKARTGRLVWHELSFDLADDSALAVLETRLADLLGQRANQDLLRLSLAGSLSMAAADRLGVVLESLQARLLRVKLTDQTVIAPTEAEIEALTECGADPLIARVAGRLVEMAGAAGEEGALARAALRELYAARNLGSAS